MSDISQTHDRFLKTLLANLETAGALLRERLPPEAAEALSDDPPELVEGSFVDDKDARLASGRQVRPARR